MTKFILLTLLILSFKVGKNMFQKTKVLKRLAMFIFFVKRQSDILKWLFFVSSHAVNILHTIK